SLFLLTIQCPSQIAFAITFCISNIDVKKLKINCSKRCPGFNLMCCLETTLCIKAIKHLSV
uniref:Uncharacterized protein n=1 Tax=Ciona intestinalis TaxID=7719 RepID=H2XUP1_CIOIN